MNSPAPSRAVVLSCESGDRYRAGRTVRSLHRAGVKAAEAFGLAALVDQLADASAGVWLLRAGSWLARGGPLAVPPPSASGRPLCALGMVRAEPLYPPDDEARTWAALRTEGGGDFGRVPTFAARLPAPGSVYLDAEAARLLARRLGQEGDLASAFRALLTGAALRVVHFPPLDVHRDEALRVVQLVTTLQRGGAERVALDLAGGLERLGLRTRLVALGRPTRGAFPTPPGTVDLSDDQGGREARLRAAAAAAFEFGADLVHGHLLSGEDTAWLSAQGLPLLLTVHNARPGWPPGLAEMRAENAALLVACAQAVEADLRTANLPIPVRTVWNGIDFGPFERTAARQAEARALRQQLGLAAEAFVLVAVANPRPQKRLELLPAVLAAAPAFRLRRGHDRPVRLLLAGEPARGSAPAALADEALRTEITHHGVGGHVHLLGAVDRVAPLLAAADVLVSCSAYEGLSLAHLEALAAGIPVVATDAGGTAELARDNPALSVLPAGAAPEQFATVLAPIAARPPADGRAAAAVHFSQHRMVEGYARLYPRAVEAARGRRRGDGLLLVINNFSTGGAQSSARRLLRALADEGVRVRAAVIQEEPEHPTPGRRDLSAAGVPVLAVPPPEALEPAGAVARLLEAVDADPPAAVLLWNVITEHKVLLADGLLGVPLFDVSPGEMYFTALERYFRRPRPGLPYLTGRDYGRRLAGMIVKFQGEAARAAEALGTTVHVIPNGVPLDGWRPRDGRAIGERLVIGTAVRISPQKKLEELCLALRQARDRLPPHVLRIAGGVERGSDAYAEEVKRLADGLSVEWAGELEDVRPFLRELDLFTMVSEPAGCPNASLEAMAEGLAVVATDVGGAAEQVEDGVTGRLVPRGDVAALAEALIELGRDRSFRSRCGAAGRARAAARFDLRRMVADYRRVCSI